MPRSSRGFIRLVNARQSRTIPEGAQCPLCEKEGIVRPVTHAVLSALHRRYACTPHALRAAELGYEIIEGNTDGSHEA